MTPSDKGLEIGRLFNQFLRKKKQIPYPTPILFNPRIQGWLNGFCESYSAALDLEEKDSHAFLSAIYVTIFDGTSTGQRMGLDALSERMRILAEGPTMGYNSIYFEFTEKGKEDGKAYVQRENHSLLLYTLL